MQKAIIFAIFAAFSTLATAADKKELPANYDLLSKNCPAGSKAVRVADLSIGPDGSGVLVGRVECAEQEPASADTKDSTTAK